MEWREGEEVGVNRTDRCQAALTPPGGGVCLWFSCAQRVTRTRAASQLRIGADICQFLGLSRRRRLVRSYQEKLVREASGRSSPACVWLFPSFSTSCFQLCVFSPTTLRGALSSTVHVTRFRGESDVKAGRLAGRPAGCGFYQSPAAFVSTGAFHVQHRS